MSNGFIIFVKNPRLGHAKTRLAKKVGDRRALEIYGKLLDKVRKTSLSVATDRYVFYSHFIDTDDDWSTQDFTKQLQEGRDLGQRMQRALEVVLSEHSKAILIGSDCPLITPEIIQEGFKALDTRDLVLGPAEDGGYYLVGLKQNHHRLFDDMIWSTSTVYEQTLQRAAEIGYTVANLPKLPDIDTEQDWLKYRHLFNDIL